MARAFGGVVIASETAPGPASHDDYGQRFVFVPLAQDKAAYALDVESRNTATPPHLARIFATNGRPFFETWTTMEVVAKLTDTPILKLVKAYTFQRILPTNIVIQRCDTSTYWIAVGKLQGSCLSPYFQ